MKTTSQRFTTLLGGGLILLVFILAVGAYSSAIAAEIWVPEDQPTIQACIDAAVTGDTCSVAPGTYVETPDMCSAALQSTCSSPKP